MARVERDDVERVPVVRMRRRGEAELGRQALGDLDPLVAAVVAAVHADVVLLVHPPSSTGDITSLCTQ